MAAPSQEEDSGRIDLFSCVPLHSRKNLGWLAQVPRMPQYKQADGESEAKSDRKWERREEAKNAVSVQILIQRF